jgi:hypothetical protein
MRSVCLCVLVIFLWGLAVSASTAKKLNDAENDGLFGPVKSVSTGSEVANPEPQRPYHGNYGLIDAIWCWVCEYDEKGNRVKQGQDWETGFVGETTQYVSDENGQARKEVVFSEKGDVVRRITMGPFGMTDLRYYYRGVLQSRNAIRYDEDGRQIEFSTFDARNVQIANTTMLRDARGRVSEQWDFGPNNDVLLHFTDVYDPETDVETFTSFNGDGTVRVTFTARNDKVVSYWQEGDKNEFGSGVCFGGMGDQTCYSYKPDATFEQTITRRDVDKKNIPIHAEFHDTNDQVQMTVDYEYEFDSRGNWTKRIVWAWTTELAERLLIRTDSRALTYWTK